MQNGTVYKKGDRWWFRYKTPVLVNGQKTWKNKYVNLAPAGQFSSRAQIEKSGILSDHMNRLDPSRMKPSTIQLVTDFIENVFFSMKQETLRPSTLKGYKHVYERHLKSRLAGKRMCDFELAEAQNLLECIVRETPSLHSSNNLRHIKWFMVSVFNLAKQKKAFNANLMNPFFEVDIVDLWKPVQRQRKTPPTRHATLDDIIQMIEALDGPAATAVATAGFTGLRKSELQALRWEDLKGTELHVQRTAWRTTDVSDQTKTEASAAPVPVIPQLAKYLEAHRDGFPAAGFIFTGPKLGRPLDLHNLAARVIRPTLAKKGIKWCGWHGFRRGLATTLYELGTDPRTRQAILRHADVAVTEKHYTKSVDAVSQAAMEKVQKAFDVKLKSHKTAAVLGTNLGTLNRELKQKNSRNPHKD